MEELSLTEEQQELMEFSPEQIKGRHWTTIGKKENVQFLLNCARLNRKCPDMLRVLVEDFNLRVRQKQILDSIGQPATQASPFQRYGPMPEELRGQSSEPSKGQGTAS